MSGRKLCQPPRPPAARRVGRTRAWERTGSKFRMLGPAKGAPDDSGDLVVSMDVECYWQGKRTRNAPNFAEAAAGFLWSNMQARIVFTSHLKTHLKSSQHQPTPSQQKAYALASSGTTTIPPPCEAERELHQSLMNYALVRPSETDSKTAERSGTVLGSE